MAVSAQDSPIEIVTSATEIRLDQIFQMDIVMTQKGSLKQPDLKSFGIVNGPMISSSSEYYNYNGVTRSRTVTRYSYQLRALAQGTFTIGSAKLIGKDGKTYKSTPVTIKVLAPGNPNYAQSEGPKLIFQCSKNDIYLGEPVVISYTVYHNFFNARVTSDEYPDQTNCWKKFLDPGIRNWPEYTTTYGGESYSVATLKKEIIIPNKSGKFVLQPFKMTILGRDRYAQQFYDLQSIPHSINVKPLPEDKPEGFCEGVGKFTVKIKASKSELDAGEGFDLSFKIKGKGNLGFINVEKPVLPKGFEVFDAEVKEKINYTESGIDGEKEFIFPVIVRRPGDYELGPIPFSYFDTEKKQYVAANSDRIKLHVGGKMLFDEQVENENPDALPVEIRDIKESHTATIFTYRDFLFGRPSFYFSLLTLPTLFFILVAINKRKKSITPGEQKALLRKKASKFATDKLKIAKAALDQNNPDLFYSETYQALNVYLEHKLGIEVQQLSKQHIVEVFTKARYEESLTKKLIDLLESCELARFGALNKGGEAELYQTALQIIDHIEQQQE